MQDADLDRAGLLCAGGRECCLDAAKGGERGGGGADSAKAAAGEREVGRCHEPVPLL